MKKATGGLRFLAFIVDAIVIGILSSVLSLLLNTIVDVKEPESDSVEVSEVMREVMTSFILDELSLSDGSDIDDEYIVIYTGMSDFDDIEDYISINYPDQYTDVKIFYSECKVFSEDLIHYTVSNLVIGLFSSALIFIIYYCIIGAYWSKQTLGRWLAHIKVIKVDGNNYNIGNLLLRDFVGFSLFNALNVCCFAPLIINAVFILGKDGQSVGDKLSNMIMVQYDRNGNIIMENDYEEFNSNSNDNVYDDIKFNTSFDNDDAEDAEIVNIKKPSKNLDDEDDEDDLL